MMRMRLEGLDFKGIKQQVPDLSQSQFCSRPTLILMCLMRLPERIIGSAKRSYAVS
jgi:hypothetical protein